MGVSLNITCTLLYEIVLTAHKTQQHPACRILGTKYEKERVALLISVLYHPQIYTLFASGMISFPPANGSRGEEYSCKSTTYNLHHQLLIMASPTSIVAAINFFSTIHALYSNPICKVLITLIDSVSHPKNGAEYMCTFIPQ